MSVLTATSRVRWAWACFLALLGVMGTFEDVDDCSGASRYDWGELAVAAVLAADADCCDVMMLGVVAKV